MRLSSNVTGLMGPLNQYTGVRRNGYLLLSGQPDAFTNAGCRAPFTRLHLIDSVGLTNPTVYAQQHGYRLWQRNGITFTGNSDQSYVGPKYSGNDTSDMVLQWSDNPEDAIYGTDRLRFLFTNRMDGAPYGARSEEGLESFRVHVPNDTSANVGIGDFYRAGIINGGLEDPTERLHVTDGTIRIDSLVPNYNNDTLSRAMVTDVNGRVHWRRINTWPSTGTGTADCKWTLLGVGSQNIATAYPGNPGCPQADKKVGIGTQSPGYKLDVLHNETNAAMSGGLGVKFIAQQSGWSYGVKSEVAPLTTGSSLDFTAGVQGSVSGVDSSGFGVYGLASAGPLDGFTKDVFGTSGIAFGPSNGGVLKSAYGAKGEAIGYSNGTINDSYGVHGKSAGGVITRSYGVYGLAKSGTYNYSIYGAAAGTNGANDWAGYFAGQVQITGNLYHGTTLIFSDASLKTSVEALPDMGSQLAALSPRKYRYTDEAQQQMGLPSGEQFGFIAQEVQENFPQLVSSTVIPARYDTTGQVVVPERNVSAVNYVGLIPVIVGAVQEQQAGVEAIVATQSGQAGELQELRDRIAQLEDMLAVCCARGDADGLRGAPTTTDALSTDPDADRKLRIQPNPFSEPPTVFYTLDRSGRMQLIANSADGKALQVLQEATQQAGSYQYAWDTTNLAPGMYYVTLLLDNQRVVRKAVKVTR